MPDDAHLTRRDVMKAAGVVTAASAMGGLEGAPAILKVRAASNQVKYGMIGIGGRGSYLLKHLTKVDTGHCAAVCDLSDEQLNRASETTGGSPARYKDYRELLSDKN